MTLTEDSRAVADILVLSKDQHLLITITGVQVLKLPEKRLREIAGISEFDFIPRE